MAVLSELSKGRRRGGKREKMSALARREARWGYLFISPWIIGFLAFYLIPMVASFVFSLLEYNLNAPEETHFIGLGNYIQLFRDPLIWRSLWITIRFMFISVPVMILVPLGLATLLNSKGLRFSGFFRTFFYMPYIVPLISAVYIWAGFLNTRTGWLNRALEAIGIPGPDWLNSTTWIYPALILVGFWGVGNAMITLFAAMQGVPTELYDAAKVDGANAARCFIHVTLPMISPVIFYNLILTVIGHFQYFLVPWVLKGPTGDPGGATMFYNLYLFKEAFTYVNMGYAATMAWLLFFLALGTTLLLFGTQKYWVYYAGGEG